MVSGDGGGGEKRAPSKGTMVYPYYGLRTDLPHLIITESLIGLKNLSSLVSTRRQPDVHRSNSENCSFTVPQIR
jgi:hypothetical protein